MTTDELSSAELTEAEFLAEAHRFLRDLRGPDHGAIDADQDLITEAGLDSIQLIAFLGFVERLRGSELDEIADLDQLTLRAVYRTLFVRTDM